MKLVIVIVIVIVVIVIVMQPFCRYAGYAPFPRLISFLSDDYDSWLWLNLWWSFDLIVTITVIMIQLNYMTMTRLYDNDYMILWYMIMIFKFDTLNVDFIYQ